MRLPFSFLLFTFITASVLALQNSVHPSVQKAYQELKNPYSGQDQAARAGRKLFVKKCARCHGRKAEGSASVPALAGNTTRSVPEGTLFAYVTRGDPGNGMPSWASLPEDQRWQIVTYLKSLPNAPTVHR